MTVAFITEMEFRGKLPRNYPNMRTEFAWMVALNADHYSFNALNEVQGYDHVFMILPKGSLNLNAVGDPIGDRFNPLTHILAQSPVKVLKAKNRRVYFVQEGPHWLWNDYDVQTQIQYYNTLATCDAILAHNQHDVAYYSGMFPGKQVKVLRTLMIEDAMPEQTFERQEKVLIGGNFARWYGGIQSFIVASDFGCEVFGQTSHAKRPGEDQMVNPIPRVSWRDWMSIVGSFTYAVHLMPTVAAGTFSLNCAYYGVPCIGNVEVDTQQICHQDLSVHVHDVAKARELVHRLKNDSDFYKKCSATAKLMSKQYCSEELWLESLNPILNG